MVRFQFLDIPATTRLVPMNESITEACRGPNSPRDRDASLHRRVAIPSIAAPKYGFTCSKICEI